MAMRLSGLMSGMDTESVIKQLVEAKSTKVTTTKKAQTKLEWKQDAWKDLNTKLKNLQSKFLSNMRFTTAYTKKTTKVSNSNAVSVITGENAVNGVQSLKIEQLAKTGYLTGGEVAGKDSDVNALTPLSELGFTGDGTINVKTASASVDIKVTGDTTISDILSQLKDAGLNASFDAKWKRFSISSKKSGEENDFSITAVNLDGLKALDAMKLQVNLNDDKATLAEYQKYDKYYNAVKNNLTDEESVKIVNEINDAISKDIESRRMNYLEQYKSLYTAKTSAQETLDALREKYENKADPLKSADEYKNAIEIKNQQIVNLNNEIEGGVAVDGSPLSEEDKQKKRNAIDGLMADIQDLAIRQADAESRVSATETIKDADEKMKGVMKYVDISGTTAEDFEATVKSELEDEVKDRYNQKAQTAAEVMSKYDPADTASKGATKESGQDALIYLNGAEYKNDTNVFEINGLTFTALAETGNETVTVTTQQDVDGMYDLIKNFLKEYNSIINEMDKLYNADSARGYEPLSDDEREAMSDSDIEKYEKKIKDSLLRRDENLSSVSSALKNVMSSGIEVNGKTMYLFNFGIETLSYFTAPENEKNAYHIAGDPDDASTSGNADVLKSMIANDPDTVISFFTKLSQNLYDKMSEMSKSVDGYRTFGSFYDDKKMKSDYDDYTSKIKELEKKLNDYEDSWYKKFAAMETTMAKMQQNSSAVTALLGG